MPTLSWYPLHLIELILEGDRTFADICDRAGAWNASGPFAVELYDGLLAPLGPVTADAARTMLDAAGVPVSLLICAPDFASPNLADRQAQFDQARHYLDTAVALGAPAVRFSAGEIHPGIGRPDALKLAAENLATLVDEAKARGLSCCVENIIRDARWHAADVSAPAASFESFLELLSGVDIGVLFNTGNPTIMMARPLEFLAHIPEEKLWGVHLSERREMDGSHVPLGDGPCPWPEISGALRGRGFDGFVGIVDGQTEGDGGSLRSLQFAREWMHDYVAAVAAQMAEVG